MNNQKTNFSTFSNTNDQQPPETLSNDQQPPEIFSGNQQPPEDVSDSNDDLYIDEEEDTSLLDYNPPSVGSDNVFLPDEDVDEAMSTSGPLDPPNSPVVEEPTSPEAEPTVSVDVLPKQEESSGQKAEKAVKKEDHDRPGPSVRPCCGSSRMLVLRQTEGNQNRQVRFLRDGRRWSQQIRYNPNQPQQWRHDEGQSNMWHNRVVVHDSFNERRNQWLRLEKLQPHHRLPKVGEPRDIPEFVKRLPEDMKHTLIAAIHKADMREIRRLLIVIGSRKMALTNNLCKRLSNLMLLGIYKGFQPLRVNQMVPIEIFPRFSRSSLACINLVDPARLMIYLGYPSLGYKLNNNACGETLWRRIQPKHRVAVYRDSFAFGAALCKRLQ
ncbi:Oidioi.mRNA.OKI2018_I69.YSR.g17194.t1.cds [Oikopleura dioica]|uniref:Oidioi.mRNA.OKI2018_I69.YSR.g17194.t1.cds n=1 Tax=Oikopleura dioica TaxID=34765 RepID=A0ABN7SM95_OIKDI|nr:Oidioi.mRNA.OKI2018_I69.YSR.g17194.t1.cds [Oikopleura dioica]